MVIKVRQKNTSNGGAVLCEESSHSTLDSSLDFREFLWVAENLGANPATGVHLWIFTISMILNGASTADQFFRKARVKKITAMGEMFSAVNLLDILQKFQSQEGFSGKYHMLEVKSDACLIVPYDFDVTHSPCLRKGHKAHWALVVGYLIDDKNQFYEIARQGNSRLLGIWLLPELAESNAILTEFSQRKQYPKADFIGFHPSGRWNCRTLRTLPTINCCYSFR
uniref:Actin maturation protease n=1 Tax=Phlebotomus papatasi TaxID=29031 RepID=A0A1B0DBT1_PHLPP